MPMTAVKGQAFLGETVDLDNKRFVGCKFTNCTLRYEGSQCEWDKDTVFVACRWYFVGAAQRTVYVFNTVHPSNMDNFHWSGISFSTH